MEILQIGNNLILEPNMDNILSIIMQLKSIQNVAADLPPIGKIPQVGGEPTDTDDEGKKNTVLFMTY